MHTHGHTHIHTYSHISWCYTPYEGSRSAVSAKEGEVIKGTWGGFLAEDSFQALQGGLGIPVGWGAGPDPHPHSPALRDRGHL